jgi:hypothetical protein
MFHGKKWGRFKSEKVPFFYYVDLQLDVRQIARDRKLDRAFPEFKGPQPQGEKVSADHQEAHKPTDKQSD